MSNTHPPLVTVVVPTFRRLPLLQRCLTALHQQILPGNQVEIVVVDDGNDADTATLVSYLARQTGRRVRYLGQPHRRGPAAARNRGWRAGRGQIIAFTDDDCIPQPDWLTAVLPLFDAGAQVVTGRVVMPLPNQPTADDRTTALLETAEFVTANCFCRRSALERVGGLDESFDLAWREDSALQFALLEAGFALTPCPAAVVVHPLRAAPWYAPLRDERKNRYDALLYRKYPALFRTRLPRYRGLVMTYYGAVGSALLAVGGTVAGNKALARTAGVSWLLLTAGLVVRRQAGAPSQQLPRNGVLSVATPFLSVFWRLYGAVKYRVWYW